MMKFSSYWDKNYKEDYSSSRYNASYIPTVDQVNEVLAPMIADTIIQIMRGDGIARSEHKFDNTIPIHYDLLDHERAHLKLKQSSERSNAIASMVTWTSKLRKISKKEAKLIVMKHMTKQSTHTMNNL